MLAREEWSITAGGKQYKFPAIPGEVPVSKLPHTNVAIVIGHELGHALVGLSDPFPTARQLPNEQDVKKLFENYAETWNLLTAHGLPMSLPCGGNVTLIENPIRISLGLAPRETYLGYAVPSITKLENAQRNQENNEITLYERFRRSRTGRAAPSISELKRMNP